MALNPSAVGKTYPPMVYDVNVRKILEYAKATKNSSQLYALPGSEISRLPERLQAPPCFVVVTQSDIFDYILTDKDLGIDQPRMVHGGQEFEFFHPIYAGDHLTTFGRILNIEDKHNFEQLDLELSTMNQDDVVVSRGVFTILIRKPK
jgi:hypothetical protein